MVEVPLAAIDFTVDKKKKTFEQRLTTLAVVKDTDGRVVERFSDEYPLSGPLDQLEAAKQSNAVLRRTVPLGAGRYTLETVSQVKGTGKTSVERSSFEVPAAGSGPQLSSLCLLRRADPLPADAPPSDDPFRYEGTRLVPHLAGPVSQAATPNLSFFARVYPSASIEMPKLTLDFVRDGKIVGRAQPPLPAPDASGQIAYVGGVPSGSFPPGDVRGAPDPDAGNGEGDRRDVRLGALTRSASRSKSTSPRQHGLRRRSSEPTSPNGCAAREMHPQVRVATRSGSMRRFVASPTLVLCSNCAKDSPSSRRRRHRSSAPARRSSSSRDRATRRPPVRT